MKYHLKVNREATYTDYMCGSFDLTPDYIILYDKDPVDNKDAEITKLVSLRDFVDMDITRVEEEH